MISGEDDRFWVRAFVDGYEARGWIDVDGIAAGQSLSPQLEKVIKDVYAKGFRAGRKHVQSELVEALGLTK